MSQQVPTVTQANKYAKSFILHGDMSKAFRAAFPDSKLSPINLNTKASKIHKTALIQSRIEALQLVARKTAEKKFSLTSSDLMKTLKKVIDKGLKNKKTAQGDKIPVSLSAVVSAVTEANKMTGGHATTTTNIELKPAEGAALEMKITSDPKESGKSYQAMLSGNSE